MSIELASPSTTPTPHGIWQALALGFVALSGVSPYAVVLEAQLPQQTSTAVLLAIFLAATISSIAGFAFSLVCAAALVHLVSTPAAMVPMLLVASIGIQTFCMWSLRHELDWRGALPFLVGGILTLPFGQMIVVYLPAHVYGATLGCLLVVYTLWTLLRPPLVVAHNGILRSLLVGAAGGVTGGIVAAPGVPVAVWCSLLGWSRVRQRSIMQPFILLMQIVGLASIHFLAPERGTTLAVDPALLAVLPPALLGAACGMWIYRRVSDRQFARVVTLFLLAVGIVLIVQGIS